MSRLLSSLLLTLAMLPSMAGAQPPDRKRSADTPVERPATGIQWFGTLEAGTREAQRLGRPILLVSAMPSCAGVPGTW